MLTQHIALVPEAYGVNPSELARVSAALQKQVTRDLAPLWGITATVDAFPCIEDVPIGYWPIVLSFKRLGDRAGVHLDRNGAPYAQIEITPLWSLHASRACLEMLINPYGMRAVGVSSARADQGPADLLVEICAPCQDARYAYSINDVLVSDFCTPGYFGEHVADGRYSANANVTAAFQVLPGGHLTWRDALSDRWWRKSYHDDCELEAELDTTRPRFGAARSVAHEGAELSLTANTQLSDVVESANARLHRAAITSQAVAQRLRLQLEMPSSAAYASQHFEMLVDLLNKDDVPVTSQASPEIIVPRAASTPPPLRTQPPTSSDVAAAAPLFSTPPLATPAFAAPASRPTSRTAIYTVGAIAAAAGLMLAGSSIQATMHQSSRANALPAYAAEPTKPAEPTPAAAAHTQVIEPVVEVSPAPVAAAPQRSETQQATDDEAARVRREERRAKRQTQAAEQVATVATQTAPAIVDPIDSLLDSRE